MKGKTYLLTDMPVPTDNNTSVKVYDEVSKYKELEIRNEKLWHLEITTVSVKMGALSMIRKKADKRINKGPGSQDLNEIQNIALCGTTSFLRRFCPVGWGCRNNQLLLCRVGE